MQTEINGHIYAFERLALPEQFHIARRLAPAVWAFGQSALGVMGGALPENVPLTLVNLQKSLMALEDGALMGLVLKSADPLVGIISRMSNEDCDYIVHQCLSKVSRKVGDGGWQVAWIEGGGFMFQDMDLPEMLQLVVTSIRRNLGNFTLAPVTPDSELAGAKPV